MSQLERVRIRVGILAIALLVGTVTPAARAADAGTTSAQEAMENILVTVRIGKLEGGARVPVKSYSLVVAAGTSGSQLLSGERVPFPATSPTDAGPGGGDPATTYVYQNVGFVSQIAARIVGEKKIRLNAEIEDSRVREEAGKPPSVETRQLTINAVLTDGKPLELTRAEGLSDQSGFVEVEAKILR